MVTKTKRAVQQVVVDIDIDKLGDDWEELADAGRMIYEAHERNRWQLGHLASKVTRKYGENSIGKFAVDIHCSPSIMYQYFEVWSFYTDEDRAIFPSLTWSHYRAAKAALNYDMAIMWLGKAADGEWTVEDLTAAMDANPAGGDPPPRPQKLADFSAELIGGEMLYAGSENAEAGYLYQLRTTRPLDLKTNKVYNVRMYGILEDAQDE